MFKFKNFSDFWSQRVSEIGGKTCLTDGEVPGRKFTFAEMDDYSDRAAYFLRQEGINKGDRFLVMAQNCPEFFFLYLASLKMGSLIMPLSPLLTESEVIKTTNRFQPTLLFADEERLPIGKIIKEKNCLIKNVFTINVDKPGSFESILCSLGRVSISYEDIQLNDPGSMYSSSGTTGEPKGIPQSPLNLLTAAESLCRAYGFCETDTQMGILPVYHTALATYGFWPGVFAGSNFVLFRRFSRQRFWQQIEQHKIAFVEVVPTILSMLLNPPEDIRERNISCCKFIGCGSAPLSPFLWRRFEETFSVPIAQNYGLSETAPTHYNPPQPSVRKECSIGKALDMYEVKIVDDKDKEIPTGEIGELVMRGDSVINSYFNDPQETAAAFRDGWFYSGDVGYKDADGFFFLVGRKKEIIIRGGINIYPVEIDNVLMTHSAISEAASFGLPDALYGEEVYAAVSLKPKSSVTSKELLLFSRQNLAEHKCPKMIFITDKIPMTPSGKPLRKELSKSYAKKEYKEPR